MYKKIMFQGPASCGGIPLAYVLYIGQESVSWALDYTFQNVTETIKPDMKYPQPFFVTIKRAMT
jgi:hypothetical protein